MNLKRKIIIFLLCFVLLFSLCACNLGQDYNTNYQIEVLSVSLFENEKILKVNQTYRLWANVYPYDATNNNIIWRSLNEEVVTVNSEGYITARKVGSAYVYAFSENNMSIYDVCFVIVEEEEVIEETINVTSISISNSQLSLTRNFNSDYTLSATVYPVNATNKNVIWESTNTNVVSVNNGFVSARGLGSAYIKVYSEENPTIYNLCLVTVTGDYSLDFGNAFPCSFLRSLSSMGYMVGEMSLTVYSVAYSFKTLSTGIDIKLTIRSKKTNARGSYSNTSFPLEYSIYDGQNVLKKNGSISISSNIDDMTETIYTVYIAYNTVPSMARFRLVFS